MSGEIINCHVKFRYKCPLTWDGLQDTDDPDQRLCNVCDRFVRRCHSEHELKQAAEAGECVSFVKICDDQRIELLGDVVSPDIWEEADD